MKTIAIFDCETGGLSPTDPLLEVAVCRWSVEHRAILDARSWLIFASTNDAEAVNGMPAALCRQGEHREIEITSIIDWCEDADAIAAHNAPFDLGFLPELAALPCIDTCEDLEWPGVKLGASLSDTALGVLGHATRGHRAIHDVLTLARCFERVAEQLDERDFGGNDDGRSPRMRFDAWLALALRPKAVYEVADRRFDPARNEQARKAGFRWDAAAKSWRRKLAVEDAAALPFKVVEVQP